MEATLKLEVDKYEKIQHEKKTLPLLNPEWIGVGIRIKYPGLVIWDD